MLLKLLLLAMMMGMVSNAPIHQESGSATDEYTVGRGFGRIVGVVTIVGAILLLLLVLAGVLSLFGLFEHDLADPPV